MTTVALGDVVAVRSSLVDPAEDKYADFPHIGPDTIERHTGRLLSYTTIRESGVQSGKYRFEAGDVLYSKIRPNLNKVALVNFEGLCSADMYALQVDSTAITEAFLQHLLRSRLFVGYATNLSSRANIPKLNRVQLLRFQFDLPPLDEQRRIAAILDHADGLRALSSFAVSKIDQMEQSIFLEMFGNPISNPHSYPFEKLGMVGTLDRGVSKHRPRNDPDLLDGPYPLIQTGDVARSGGTIATYTATYSEKGLAQSKMWPAGTLCITIAANIAQTGVLAFDACFPDSVVGFTADESTTVYVRTWLTFLQATLEAAAPQSAQRNINLAILRDLPVPLPPLVDRQRFCERLRAIQNIRSSATLGRQQSDYLFGSLQVRAFSGQL